MFSIESDLLYESPSLYAAADSMAWLLLGSPWKSQAVLYVFRNIYSEGSTIIVSVTLDSIEGGVEYSLVSAQFLSLHQLASSFPHQNPASNLVTAVSSSISMAVCYKWKCLIVR